MSRHHPLTHPALIVVASLATMLLASASSSLAQGVAGAQAPVEVALAHLESTRGSLGLSAADLAELKVTDHYVSGHTGVTHVHLRQQIRGIDVVGATIGVHVVADGRVIHLGDRLLRRLEVRPQSNQLRFDAKRAVERAAAQLGLAAPVDLMVLEQSSGPRRETTLSSGGIALGHIPARLVYQPTPDGELRLAWNVEIYPLDARHYWSVRVDAGDGTLLEVDDWVDRDDYRVYPWPIETPNHTSPAPPGDGRTLAVDPHLDGIASPFGWHDTNGAAGAEFTFTQGNNVHAYTDTNGDNVPDPGSAPDCGASLICDFPLDLTMAPSSYIWAAVTNLFYWNNVIHDVMYEYGFDEPAGNFQANNYGNGGLGNDFVRAEAQDGGGNCTANFATLADGSSVRMQMYTCNAASPARDGVFDNMVIVHEYGHGISNRLTGGPSNVDCLNNSEQMGEGWSDWLGLMFTQQASQAETLPRGFGTWLFGQDENGPGSRPAPYTPDMGVNGFTYSDLPGQSVPDGVGFVWATMLWDVNWALIDEYGFNPNIYDDWTTGGNNLALQLITDGMKLQTCSPGFVDGRDAILAADDVLTGDGSPGSGANQCILWEAFANRGLGASADQGSANNTSDGTEAFDLPQSCLGLAALDEVANVCADSDATFTLEANWPLVPPIMMSVSGHPPGTTPSFLPNPVNGPLPQTTVLTIGNTGGVAAGTYPMTATADDGNQMLDAGLELNLFDATPGTPALVAPADGATEVPLVPTYQWTPVTQEYEYLLEVDDDPGFGSIDYMATVVGANSHTPETPLEPTTTYFWRVTSANQCGSGGASPVFSFTTILTFRDGFESGDISASSAAAKAAKGLSPNPPFPSRKRGAARVSSSSPPPGLGDHRDP